MLTETNIATLPEATAIEPLPALRKGFFAKHWRGDYSLPRSYWLHGALIFGLGINLPCMIIASIALMLFQLVPAFHNQPVFVLIICLGEVTLDIAAYIWALVGTWRSAGKYQGPRIWAILARLGMLFGVIFTLTNLLQDIAVIDRVFSGGPMTM